MPCFSTGTLVTTLRGEVPVEGLKPGDRVVTRDNGLQSVRGIARRSFDYANLAGRSHLQPVLVTVGALGKGLPERDMLVSPNTRLLVIGERSPFAPQSRETLIAAKNLINQKSIRTCSVLGVNYVHVELARHEVILANGAWVEAFQLGDLNLGPVGNAQRTELREILPLAFGEEARDGVA